MVTKKKNIKVPTKKTTKTTKSKKIPYTHISVILDRSGSMETLKKDTIGGFNNFIKEQKKLPDKATLSLIQFDSQDPYEIIHSFKPIKDIPELTDDTFKPRASTPLLDAMGRGINDIDNNINNMKNEKPDKIMVVIITDGQENASREYTKDSINKLISSKNGWEFVYLSSDLNAVADAQSYGFPTMNISVVDNSSYGTKCLYTNLSERSSSYRTMTVDTDQDDNTDNKKKKITKSKKS